jgi:hypothetical protein
VEEREKEEKKIDIFMARRLKMLFPYLEMCVRGIIHNSPFIQMIKLELIKHSLRLTVGEIMTNRL